MVDGIVTRNGLALHFCPEEGLDGVRRDKEQKPAARESAEF